MTRIRIPAPDIEADVSAEQVTAYLLANGWTAHVFYDDSAMRSFEHGDHFASVPLCESYRDFQLRMQECLADIARAEGRPPSAVLADIVGPGPCVAPKGSDQ